MATLLTRAMEKNTAASEEPATAQPETVAPTPDPPPLQSDSAADAPPAAMKAKSDKNKSDKPPPTAPEPAASSGPVAPPAEPAAPEANPAPSKTQSTQRQRSNSTQSKGGRGKQENGAPTSGSSKLLSRTNLHLFLQNTTPMLPVHESAAGTVFNMQDIWRFYDAPYGFGVPIVLEGEDCEVYYNPFISAIQLWTKPPPAAADDSASLGPQLAFEFFETETPFQRPPLVDRVNQLARDNPHIAELLVSGTSADIAACSWFAISWYPIVCGSQANMRPIMGAILSYHALTVPSVGAVQPQAGAADVSKHSAAEDAPTVVGVVGSAGESSAGDGESPQVVPLCNVKPESCQGHWGHDSLLQLPSVHDVPGSSLILLDERVRHPIDGTKACWVEDTYTVPVAVDSPKDSLTEVHVPLPLIGYLPYKLHTPIWYAQTPPSNGNESSNSVSTKKSLPPYFLGRSVTHMLNNMGVRHPDKIHVDMYTGGSNNLFECVCQLCKKVR